ncbi:unannotated protein [freshwater metagenome]|uniref:Unannotated protein n=1 Tax=freshwater metagenome TaxID=449393 RepID=A0A6J5YIN3_9ZZZZ
MIAKGQMWGKPEARHHGTSRDLEVGGGGVVLYGADSGEVDDGSIGKSCLGQPPVEKGLAQSVHRCVGAFALHLDDLTVEGRIRTRRVGDRWR